MRGGKPGGFWVFPRITSPLLREHTATQDQQRGTWTGPLLMGERDMTIQIGRLSVHYDVSGEILPQTQFLLGLKWLGNRHPAKKANNSVISAVVRRWLVTPAIAGVAIGMLMQ